MTRDVVQTLWTEMQDSEFTQASAALYRQKQDRELSASFLALEENSANLGYALPAQSDTGLALTRRGLAFKGF
jgi:hypothetical protein